MEQLKQTAANLDYYRLSGKSGIYQYYTCFKDDGNHWFCTEGIFDSPVGDEILGSKGKDNVRLCRFMPDSLKYSALNGKYPDHSYVSIKDLKPSYAQE